jgi:AcrR family transcriptional regulator
MPGDSTGPQSDSSTVLAACAGSPGRRSLPLLGHEVVRERADAVRNRRKVLEAAAALYRERGVDAVSMDDIAVAAGVGKGTLYRRFGDKSALAAALLDERERELQGALLGGPPPLGPGAAPDERLAAFAGAYLRYVAGHADLVALSQTASPGARLRTGAHRFWRQHCAYLLEQAGVADPRVRADILLAGLSAEQVRHWLQQDHQPVEQIADAVTRLARDLCRT